MLGEVHAGVEEKVDDLNTRTEISKKKKISRLLRNIDYDRL